MSGSATFNAVKPGIKLAEQVASTLEAEIRAGRLAVGTKLPTEAALVAQFQVSRTVVREAISRLKSLGLVDARQGSGVYVQSPGIEPLDFDRVPAASLEAVLQIVDVRRALEAEVAELAAEHRTPADVRAIRTALQALADAVAAGRDGSEEDVRFHRAIALASGNPFMLRTLDYLARFLRGATRVTRANEARRTDFSEAVKQEHQQIVDAIAAGDPQAARAAAAQHMRNAKQRLSQADPRFWQEDGQRLARGLVEQRPK